MNEPSNQRLSRASDAAAAGRGARRLLAAVVVLLILLNLFLMAYALGWLE